MAFISPLPGRSRTLVRPSLQILRACQEQRPLLTRSSKGVTRRIFFDPSLSFDPTTPEPRSSSWRRSLRLGAQKMVSTTVLFSDHDRNGSPAQAVGARNFSAAFGPPCGELPRRRDLTQIVLFKRNRSQHEFRQRQRRRRRAADSGCDHRRHRASMRPPMAPTAHRAGAALLSETFETSVAAFLVATGTAANALALSALVNPWDAVFCHEEAHVHDDECGAPELFTGGAKLVGIARGGRQDHASRACARRSSDFRAGWSSPRSRGRCRCPRRPKRGRSMA